uniref:Phospholipase A and acyltransferase 1-like n=1 Tax=Cyprinus carpio carpio TaxID=630221 RepID=A0A9J8AUD6_CYPCA
MFLSAVWTLILTAPIHCRGSIAEQVMQCYISPNLMKKQTHLHLGLFTSWTSYDCSHNISFQDSDTKLLLFGRAINASVKLDPLDVVGKKYKVSNYLDDKHPPRDFYVLIKPEIDEVMTKPITFDILFNNSEHQATMLRYGVKKSEQVKHFLYTKHAFNLTF